MTGRPGPFADQPIVGGTRPDPSRAMLATLPAHDQRSALTELLPRDPFDDLARSMAASVSRRSVVKLLLGATAAGALAAVASNFIPRPPGVPPIAPGYCDPPCDSCSQCSQAGSQAICVPGCDACSRCIGGRCFSNCQGGCEVCIAGRCQSTCPGCGQCDDGECRPCDASRCEACVAGPGGAGTCLGCDERCERCDAASGTCVSTCAGGVACCGGSCAGCCGDCNHLTGTCINADAPGALCFDGMTRPQCCGVKCYDIDNDPEHCGDCDHNCADTGDDLCCGGACVDPRTDLEHCGGCDRGCLTADAICCNGVCVSPEVAEQMGTIECCPPERRCIDRSVCCPKGSRCTGTGFDERCTCAPGWDDCRAEDGELVCCPPGQKCCGNGVCIPDNEFCCPPGQRWLESCGCCPEGSTCRNGRCEPPECPGVTTPCEVFDENGELVVRVCCSAGQVCLNDGGTAICQAGCGNSYCTDGEVCCEARGDCLPPGYPCCQPGESPYQFDCASGCCPPDTHVCGCCVGTCKKPDEVCECE